MILIDIKVERHTPPVVGTVSWSTGVGLSIVGMTTTSLLIPGIRTSAWIFFVFWLVWDSLCLTFNIFIFVADVTQAFNGTESIIGTQQFYMILGNLAGISVGSYFWIVVNSMRREMKRSRSDDDSLLIPEEAKQGQVKTVVKWDWRVVLGGLNKITRPLDSVQEKKRHK